MKKILSVIAFLIVCVSVFASECTSFENYNSQYNNDVVISNNTSQVLSVSLYGKRSENSEEVWLGEINVAPYASFCFMELKCNLLEFVVLNVYTSGDVKQYSYGEKNGNLLFEVNEYKESDSIRDCVIGNSMFTIYNDSRWIRDCISVSNYTGKNVFFSVYGENADGHQYFITSDIICAGRKNIKLKTSYNRSLNQFKLFYFFIDEVEDVDFNLNKNNLNILIY